MSDDGAMSLNVLALSLVILFIGLCAFGSRILLTFHVKREPERRGNVYVMQYAWPMRLVTLLRTFVAVVVVCLILVGVQEQPIATFVATLVGVAAVAANLEFFGRRISWDEWGVESRSPLRRTKKIPWQAVKAISYRPVLKCYELTSDGYGAIRMPDYLCGRAWLIEELENRGIVVSGIHRPLEP